MHNVPKQSDTLQKFAASSQTHFKHLLQDFQSVSDHFGTLCIKELTAYSQKGCSK